MVERLRRDRPDPAFTISLRTEWDPQATDPAEIRRQRDEFAAAGIQYVLSAPTQADGASYLRSIELLAELVLDG